jgi:AcrR family transcriptional regulator
MVTPEPDDPRQRLLDAAIDYAAHHGIAGLGLRPLAVALGTSHRMLIYHFGSKEGLLVEMVRAIEARQRQLLATLAEGPADSDGPGRAGSPADRLWTMWHHLTDPALAPWERLFFEVYGQALQGRPHTAAFLDDAVDAWLEPLASAVREAGVPEGDAYGEARLALAVTRGLLLDLLATGDRQAVDDAMARFAARYEDAAQRSPESGSDSESGSGAGTLPRSSRSRAPASR